MILHVYRVNVISSNVRIRIRNQGFQYSRRRWVVRSLQFKVSKTCVCFEQEAQDNVRVLTAGRHMVEKCQRLRVLWILTLMSKCCLGKNGSRQSGNECRNFHDDATAYHSSFHTLVAKLPRYFSLIYKNSNWPISRTIPNFCNLQRVIHRLTTNYERNTPAATLNVDGDWLETRWVLRVTQLPQESNNRERNHPIVRFI